MGLMASRKKIERFLSQVSDSAVAQVERLFKSAALTVRGLPLPARNPRDWGWAVNWDNGAGASGTFDDRYATEGEAEEAAGAWAYDTDYEGDGDSDEAGDGPSAEAVYVGDADFDFRYAWLSRQFVAGALKQGLDPWVVRPPPGPSVIDLPAAHLGAALYHVGWSLGTTVDDWEKANVRDLFDVIEHVRKRMNWPVLHSNPAPPHRWPEDE
jgi:hypothetical protein